jgi:4-hydroxybenzoate polyprenyltransferase
MQIRTSRLRREGPAGRPDGAAARLRRGADALVFSSAWEGAVAVALLAAAANAMEVELAPAAAVVAFGGTLAVYGLDRLRDVARDRLTAPARTAFVERHARGLTALTAAGAGTAIAAALWLGPPVWLLCGGVLALGLAHRRMKQVPIFKGLYVTAAWLAVVLGLPILAETPAASTAHAGWAAGILSSAILGNVVASSLRDAEAGAARSPGLALGIARGLPVLGVCLALIAPAAVRALVWVPALLALVLLRRPGVERWGPLAVDGALGAGALLSLLG